MSKCIKRINTEIKELEKDPLPGIRFNYDPENLKLWKGEMDGPEGTPYYGYILKVSIKFTDNYPFESPKISFDHEVYHPNVSKDGTICLDILKDQWSPSLSISKVLLSLSSLLNDPNPHSALNGEAGRNWINDKSIYNLKVREICEKKCKKNIEI